MNADEFVFQARRYGYTQINRVHPDGGLYHVEARRGGKDKTVLTWFGTERSVDGHVSSNLTGFMLETARVQKVVDEVRAR